ncbi:serine/threonine transporter SstT [Fibrobacter sp.]|uniref:serine/threonine transporter SstT n=1 Tax=Fibrobacter sp. TaxID=35828 RepID=UPI0038909468
MKLKTLIKKYNSANLVLRIAIAIILGALLGLFFPTQKWISEFGVLFVGALKAVAPVLVFVMIICSLATGKSRLDRRFGRVVSLYLVSTLLASFAAFFSSLLFPQNLDLNVSADGSVVPADIYEILHNLLVNAVSNPFAAISDANYIGILVWAAFLGLAIKKIASPVTFTVLQDVSNAVSMVVRWIINLAPFGIMGIMYTSVSTNGIGIFKTYGSLILVLVGTMLFVMLVVVPALVGLVLRHDPYPLVLKCLKSSAVTAFFTRSSAANIPVNMALCKKLGLDSEFYSVSIPLGATINMSGAAITITVMTLATVHTLGIPVTLTSTLIVCILATIGACGTSGVAGGSLLLIPLACAPFGISTDVAMQVVAVGFIIGVVQDSLETALNSSTDAIFTATAEYRAWQKQGKPLPEEFFKKEEKAAEE